MKTFITLLPKPYSLGGKAIALKTAATGFVNEFQWIR